MTRSTRLLDLIQLLRTYRRPVSGAALAQRLGISIRTLYRDIATLQAQGADIQGAPGFGYVLKPGFLMPPMMLSEEEIEALVLGARWVAARTDDELKDAARNALAKIAAVLPADLRRELETNSLLVSSARKPVVGITDLAAVREAIRQGFKLDIGYADINGRSTNRRIWPFALGYFEETRVLAAWCELREDFRHFRAERIASMIVTDIRVPQTRGHLLAEWRRVHNVKSDM
ncbi:helix-turn-helix transcriptional regulator [Rhizobium giardinii]|jgi:predicted DNA-binding transcriptional regulator YafY|uniref:Putative DNA-binding transcriptional regulator YafY n=1 Tax=Rhizobium giardinii TaxID=56731 RepID=A0A7W8X7S5_9HYPH|nr:YafY family protein [Rhizobium giardinii]MBB5535429.1 putative DNA-binding transcriptional regulator YafY [Rhizobium giardinii]